MADSDVATRIITIANIGVNLSIRLYTFSETVATASSEIKNLARDVSFTSSLLSQLSLTLQHDEQAETKLSSSSAVQTAMEAMSECEVVFQEIDDVLAKATESVAKRWPKKGGKVALAAADRVRWPFLQPRMVLLKGNLERLKSTLVLMVNVLTYAAETRGENKDLPREDDIYQRTLLENLFLANQQASRKYETILKTLESHGMNALTQETTSESDLAPTVRDPLKRIERALLQFERSAPISYGTSRMAVQIEVEKDLARPRDSRARPHPWVLLSIVRKEQEIPPSYNESWIPSEGEMYGSFAAGAMEGLTVEEDRSRSRSRSRVRFQDQGQDDYRFAQPGPSGRGRNHGEIDETEALMYEGSSRGSRQGPSYGAKYAPLTDKSDPLGSGAVKFRKGGPRTKTWYSSLLESIPSPTSAINTLQKSVQNTGLFFGLEDEKERADTVLEYRGSRLASPPPPKSPGAKLARSTTFDEMLRSPSSEGQFTPPSTVVSKEEAPEVEKHAETEIHAPRPISAAGSAQTEQKIPFLVPSEDDGRNISGRTTPEANAGTKTKVPEEKPAIEPKDNESAGETAAESAASEKTGESQMSEKADAEVKSKGKGKGKAKDVASVGQQPDEIDQLLKEWTTVYEE